MGVVFVILSTLTRTYSPRLVQKLIDNIIQKLNAPSALSESIESLVIHFLILFLSLTLISALFTFLMRQTIIVTSRKIEFELKNKLYAHIQNLSMEHFKKYPTGDFMSRIGEDIGKIREVYGPAIMYLINLVTTLGITIYFMLDVSPTLSLWALLPLPLLSIFVYVYNMYMYRYNIALQRNLASLTTIAQESYNGIRVLKSFTLEDNQQKKFAAKSQEYKNQSLKIVKIDSLFFPISTFLMSLSILITIYVGGHLYFDGKITLGNLTEFIMYVNNLTWPIMSIGWVANLFQRGKAAATRYDEIMQLPIEDNRPKETVEGLSIEFRNVSFTYPDTGIRALQNISFAMREGESWLIVGKTGGGKSTLAELLMKFYDNYEGEILIGGKSLKSLDISSVRSIISYIPQDVFLFSDTVEQNIAFSEAHSSKEEIVHAAQKAQIHEEILGFKDGYQTVVGERGITLSGGQKQRISIARALLKSAPIYLFDDSLSAVDVETERRLVQAINQSKSDKKTLLMITHRVFNHLQFDKILVLNEGRIEETGTQEELMARQGYYYELYKKQEIKYQYEQER